MAAFGGVGGGGNMAFRRSALESLGGFDETLGRGTPMYGGEEQFAFLRLVKDGFKVVYCPRAIVRHPLPHTMPLLRGRYLKNLSASTAFFTKLFVELPSHRWDIAKYVFEALRKKPRPWRGGMAPAPPEFVSQFERVRALLAGPLCYAGVRLRQRS
jgi:cellulose synthase/poly-beta-1,6-N-acetylglucosamine synthase-like glycosyltransferase